MISEAEVVRVSRQVRIVFQAVFIAVSGLSDPPPVGNGNPAAKLFADSRAELQARTAYQWKDLGLERPSWSGPYVTWTAWQRLAADTRPVAERIASAEITGMAAYLQEHAQESPLLALLALDTLRRYNEAAQTTFRLMAEEQTKPLLYVSFCSAQTREATVNLLAQNLPELPAGFPAYLKGSIFDFMALAGNARTIEFLDRAAQKPHGEGWKQVCERTASQVRLRIALPRERQSQRAKDDLLFWQTVVGAPVPRDITSGLVFAVKCLAAQKLIISSTYLIEQLEQAKDAGHVNQSRVQLALLILASQKNNDAVPAMMNLARRIPFFQKDVENVLKQLNTSEASKGLEELGAHDQ